MYILDFSMAAARARSPSPLPPGRKKRGLRPTLPPETRTAERIPASSPGTAGPAGGRLRLAGEMGPGPPRE